MAFGGVPARMNSSATVLPEKATHQQTRTFNQQLVLRALHDHSPLSRADLARLTGLTRTSVGDLVGTLIEDGLIEEVGRGRSSGGKSPILLRVAPDGRHLIGLDLGEAQFSGAVVNLRGEILRSIHLPLEGRDGDAAVELVFRLVDALRADDRSPLLGIGVGAPGIIDTSTGTVLWSVLNWAELRLGPLLEDRYGVPIVVANDSHAAALAELTFFRRPRPNNLVVIRVGRGVGAGIILNGQLFQGDGYGAGEFGHVSMGSGDASCRCGRVGCLETIASMRALVGAAGAVEPSITDESGLVAAFLAGVARIRQIVFDAARELGVAVGWLIGVLNVHTSCWSGRSRRSAKSGWPRSSARRARASWHCLHATRGSSSATSTTTSSCWVPRPCSWSSSWAWDWCDDRDLRARARSGGWSPASTSAAPRRRSSSPTIGTGSSTSTSSRRTGRRSSARSPVSSTAPGASCGRTSPRSASPSPATSIRRTARSAWPSTWASRTWRWDRCCRRVLGLPTFVEHDARAAARLAERAGGRRVGAGAGEPRLPGDRDRHLGRYRSRRGAAPRRQQRCRRGGPRRRRPRMEPPARAVCAAASRRSPPVRPSVARPTRRSLPVAARS